MTTHFIVARNNFPPSVFQTEKIDSSGFVETIKVVMVIKECN